tara:strand:- start:292 stop:516 length:225 start_codon:yes stop_codon:yes gene_type:complete
MFGAYLLMSWTVIMIDCDRKVSFLNSYAPHDKNVALEDIKLKYGSYNKKINGRYVIAIVPGNHPIYPNLETPID